MDQRACAQDHAGGVVTSLAGGGSATGTSTGIAYGTGSAAIFTTPAGIAIDSNNLVYLAEYNANVIRTITMAGLTSPWVGGGAGTGTSAGMVDGTGTNARIFHPAFLAIGSNNIIYIADTGNNREEGGGRRAVAAVAREWGARGAFTAPAPSVRHQASVKRRKLAS